MQGPPGPPRCQRGDAICNPIREQVGSVEYQLARPPEQPLPILLNPFQMTDGSLASAGPKPIFGNPTQLPPPTIVPPPIAR